MPHPPNVAALTAQIVAAHLTRNQVSPEALPELIVSVNAALLAAGTVPIAETAQQPAVPIRRSVLPSHIVCLEDGRQMKMLKRHLQSDHGMTPRQYRAKWGLPDSYPMTAPNYASQRSELAKKIGLGRKAPTPGSEPVVRKIPARKARGANG